MAETIQCPACDNISRQERMGAVRLERKPNGTAPVLYRCCACGCLYTVPKLPDPC